jgi:N-acetylmuramoyl-L-alanine amidase
VKKTVFLCILGLLFIAVSVPAQSKAGVRLKFSKQDALTRVVFEAEETFIQRIRVTASPSRIKLDFPEPFTLTGQKDLPFEMTQTDRSLVIHLRDKSDTKNFSLKAPARLVLDIRKKETQTAQSPKDTGKQIEKPAEKQPEKPSEKQPAAPSPKVFVIDPGHGGYDFGITYGNVSEKDISMHLAKDLGAALSKKGKKVFFVRKVDQYVPLLERINFVNQKNPDVFISLHASTSEKFALYGAKFDEQISNENVALYSLSMKQKKYAGKSKTLANCVEKAIKEGFKGDVIRRELPLPVISSIGAPAVLVEVPSPRFVVYDQQMKSRLINAIINGIESYGQ